MNDASLWPNRKAAAKHWFLTLRDRLCTRFESIESTIGDARFVRTPWSRDPADGQLTSGGGEMSLLRGDIFEKAGVNVSEVHGEFSDVFRKEIPGAADDPRFWAAGISVVVHPHSPHIPAVHMNTRMIVIGDPIAPVNAWFGGGADLTPIVPNAVDTADFHAALKATCDAHGPDYYDRYKPACDAYFHLKHRDEPRGVGGIFYDYLKTDWNADFAFTQAVGSCFASIYPALAERHMHQPWTEAERAYQLQRRGRYVEFNLLYDRGTRFGLMTGGNTEAILMSLPPLVTW